MPCVFISLVAKRNIIKLNSGFKNNKLLQYNKEESRFSEISTLVKVQYNSKFKKNTLQLKASLYLFNKPSHLQIEYICKISEYEIKLKKNY